MKKNLLKKSNKGFSLVELIVVIAIMAILVGVAVPVYGAYIEKTQKAKDKQLVDEVVHALQIYYTANSSNVASDYVVLTLENADAKANSSAEAAMKAAFGENWRDELCLEYDNWTNDGLLDLVLSMTDEEIKWVADSTFLTKATTEGMMNTVTNLTGIVCEAIEDSNLASAFDRLSTLLGANNSVVTTLNTLEIDENDEDFSTVVSNLLVGYFSEVIAGDTEDPSALTELCMTYAAAYAYSQTEDGNDALLKELDTYMNGLSFNDVNNLGTVEEGQTETNLKRALENMNSYVAFTKSDYYGENGAVNTDAAAFLTMMNAVNTISGTYTNKDTLADKGMYSSSSVAGQINNYTNAVKAVASGIDTAALDGLPEGSVVIFVTENGVASVVPEMS